MAVITISRQYGSGGKEIARNICDILGYSYFDKSLMVEVASEVGGLDADHVVDFSEDTYKMHSFLEKLFGRRRVKVETWKEDHSGERSLQIQSLDEEAGVGLVRDTIHAAYERGNVVIVGRGGQAILREQPGVLHVRIIAPLGARALRLKERDKITMIESTNLATRKDQVAEAYLDKFFGIDWDDPLLYHLLINTGKCDLDTAARIIVDTLPQLRTIPGA